MNDLDNTKVGDKVVYGREERYNKVTVFKVSKTQITVDDGTRFNKRDGVRIGDGDSWHRTSIYMVRTDPDKYWNQVPMTWEQADERIEAKKQSQERHRIARRITTFSTNQMAHNATIEQLKKAADLLGIDLGDEENEVA